MNKILVYVNLPLIWKVDLSEKNYVKIEVILLKTCTQGNIKRNNTLLV